MTRPRSVTIQEHREPGWRFVRTFSVGDLLQFIGIALFVGGPILVWGRAIEQRVLTLENFNTASMQADVRRDADTREQRQAFSGRMDKIEEKLGQLQVTAAQLLAGQQNVPRGNPNPRR